MLTAYSPSGHILFETLGRVPDSIWALPFSLSKLEATGEPLLVYSGAATPSVADDGTLLYEPQAARI
jgi:hypothetical protein